MIAGFIDWEMTGMASESTTNPKSSVLNLVLPALLARQIEAQGQSAYPNECCGIMYGQDRQEGRVVQQIEAAANVFDQTERHHRFSISPQQLMQAEKTAADLGLLVVGFYHSHPDHPASPSEYDRQHAWPFYSYVIVSVAQGQAVDMTSWVLDEEAGIFVRQEICET